MSDIQARHRRRWLYLPFTIAAVIVAGYYALWRAGAAEMTKAVTVWAEDQRAAGFDVSYDSLRRDGFPFFLRVHVDNPSITTPEGLSWRSERLSLDALPYQLNKIIFSAQGAHFLDLAEYGEWRITAPKLLASISRDPEREWLFSAEFDTLLAERDSDNTKASIGRMAFDFAPLANDRNSLQLVLAGANMRYREHSADITVDTLQLATELSQTHRLSGDDPAAQWRDADGILTISGLIAEFNDATISVSGTLSLDAAAYPVGRLRTQITNPAGVSESLASLGVMTPQEAEAAAAGLTLMALTGGGKVTAPIELEGGQARIRGFKTIELPRIQ